MMDRQSNIPRCLQRRLGKLDYYTKLNLKDKVITSIWQGFVTVIFQDCITQNLTSKQASILLAMYN